MGGNTMGVFSELNTGLPMQLHTVFFSLVVTTGTAVKIPMQPKKVFSPKWKTLKLKKIPRKDLIQSVKHKPHSPHSSSSSSSIFS